MDREELERFRRRGRSRRAYSGGVEKIGLQRIAFELMQLEEAKLTQGDKEIIAEAKEQADRMPMRAWSALQDQFLEEYYGIRIEDEMGFGSREQGLLGEEDSET